MAALTRRQVLTTTGGGLAALAVSGLVGNAVVRVLVASLTGQSQATAFGRVTVLGVRHEHHRAPPGLHPGVHVGAGPGELAPEHLFWTDRVRVEIEVENASRRPVLVSPGQFRLRVGQAGPTVSLYDAGHRAVALAPGTALATWVAFLAPPAPADFAVEYTEAGSADPHTFVLATEVAA